MIGEYLGIAGLIAANVGANIGIYRYFQGRIDKLNSEQDAKTARVYERLDEVRKGIDSCFVQKETCNILHMQTANNLVGAESRLEKRFDKMEVKMETMLIDIFNLLKTINNK